MDTHHVIVWLLIGLIAGALAGRVVRGSGFGILGDIVVGLVGAFVGGWILNAVTGGGDATSSFVGECVVAFLGAVVLLWLVRLVSSGGRGHRTALRR